MEALYVNIGPYLYERMAKGFQFFHTVEVIDYLDNPIFGPHEKFAVYDIGYCIKEVKSTKPFRAVVTVIAVRRIGAYLSLDKNKVFHTPRGKQFYPKGILHINLPEIGEEFEVIDNQTEYDLIKGYIYSLHKVILQHNEEDDNESMG